MVKKKKKFECQEKWEKNVMENAKYASIFPLIFLKNDEKNYNEIENNL